MKNTNKLFKHTLLLLSCILLTALGFTILNADSTTTIGLDISTGSITSTGTITSQDLTVQKSDDTTLTVYSNTDTPTADDKLLIIQKGTTPSELFSVDEDGDVSITNDLAITGNITTGTWQGTPITTQYGGTGSDWSAITQGNLPYFSDTGTLSNLAPGTTGQFLKSQGTGADPAWTNVTRSATFVVAANDSSALSKQQADYVCDGTDDQVQIQAAIDALPDGGGKVVLMEGEYNISSEILIQNKTNIVLSGLGHSSILKSTANNSIIKVGHRTNAGLASTYITIQDLQVDGTTQDILATTPETTDAKLGIQFCSPAGETEYFSVLNCKIYNTGGDGIYGFFAGEALIEGNIIIDVRGYWGGIHPHAATGSWQIRNNYLEGCAKHGIRHGTIIGNVLSSCGQSGFAYQQS